jgi:hypothetical protein
MSMPPAPPNGFRRNDVMRPAPLPMIASNDNVRGILGGYSDCASKRQNLQPSIGHHPERQRIQGRDTESAQKVPLSLVTVAGQFSGHSVVIREMEELASNTGAQPCLQTAHLTVSEDGGQMMGRFQSAFSIP